MIGLGLPELILLGVIGSVVVVSVAVVLVVVLVANKSGRQHDDVAEWDDERRRP